MVRFKDTDLIIEYKAGANAVEEWQGLMDELIWVFTMLTPDKMPKDGLWRLASLMAEMQPDYEVARKMLND